MSNPPKPEDRPTLPLFGRDEELDRLSVCLTLGKSVILEGPVGVGKTRLALAAIARLNRVSYRIDGDNRYSEQKLTGWFDPPSVMKHGFSEESFVEGPLALAMKNGGVLFINELNRLPEGVQNVLLPALDEGILSIPRVKEIRAAPGFVVIATQNPKEFVATTHLSEAILDRFELIHISYQPEEEELKIVSDRLSSISKPINEAERSFFERIARLAVRLCRSTRQHPSIRRGASVRAAISIAELTQAFCKDARSLHDSFKNAALLALPTRIELSRDSLPDGDAAGPSHELIDQLVAFVFAEELNADGEQKKN